jgi:hypothetical protein
MFTVTLLVIGHKLNMSGRQTAEDKTRQVDGRLFGVIEAVLQEQGIEIGAHHQIDRHGRFIQWRLAFKVTGLTPRQQDFFQQPLHPLLVGKYRLPALRGGRGGDFVEFAVMEKQPEARFRGGFKHLPQLFWRGIGRADGGADISFNLAQTVGADHLADGLFGFKKLVNVSLGKPNGLGEIRNRGFGIAKVTEMFGSRDDDLIAHLVVDWAPG